MSKRNIVWLVIVIAAGVIGVLIFGFPWGLLVALGALVVSEIVERTRRSRLRRGESGGDGGGGRSATP